MSEKLGKGFLNKLIKKSKLASDNLSPQGNLGIIYNLERYGQMEKALQQIENLEFDLKFDSQVTKCRLLKCSGKLDESLSLSEDILPQIIEQEKKELELSLKTIEGLNYYYLNDFESVYEVISNLQTMINNFTDQELDKFHKPIAWYIMLQGYYLEAKGDLNESLEYLEQSLHLLKNQGYLYYESVILGHIGRIYSSKGELDNAMDKFIHELEIAKRTKEFNRIARATLNVASLNWRKGKIKKERWCSPKPLQTADTR